MALLAIDSQAEYNDLITSMEYHTHQPYVSTTFKNNDEIRIPILQQDIITAPYDSYIILHGKVSAKKADGVDLGVKWINNAMAFLFEEIRFEIFNKEIDRVKGLGIATTMKHVVSIREDEKNTLKNAAWFGPGEASESKDFVFSIPLKMLLGFAEDYKKVLINVKQELVLLRSSNDANAVITTDAGTLSLDITKIYWRVPHITVNDSQKLKLYKFIERDPEIHVPFRQWELHEYPNVPTSTDTLSWTLRTSTQLEKPRYIILAFQTGRKNDLTKDMSQFDSCDISDVKLYLNSNFYPYDNIRGNTCLFYDMYANFQRSYYGRTNAPILSYTDFKTKCPLYVIDCSKQDDTIKMGPVDVRLDIQANKNFPANTWAYCLIIHDSHYTYTPITGDVRKVSV